MKLKFTWGTGILITIIVFVSFFIGFIIFSLTQDVNLVTKNYFPDEIAYDTKIEKIKNTDKLKNKINISVKNNILTIKFPDEITYPDKVKGTILLYYIKSYRDDKKFTISLDENKTQKINITTLKKGRYKIKTDWTYNGKNYFQEKITEIKQ